VLDDDDETLISWRISSKGRRYQARFIEPCFEIIGKLAGKMFTIIGSAGIYTTQHEGLFPFFFENSTDVTRMTKQPVILAIIVTCTGISPRAKTIINADTRSLANEARGT